VRNPAKPGHRTEYKRGSKVLIMYVISFFAISILFKVSVEHLEASSIVFLQNVAENLYIAANVWIIRYVL
jgi:hypothetical protein